MYRLINQNIDLILTTLDYHLAIETHLSILRRFNQGDVRHDTSFHLDYRRYWGLNAARLSETFCLAYFDLMEGLRTNHNIDTETVVRHLYQLPTHKKGRQSLQFSFASKIWTRSSDRGVTDRGITVRADPVIEGMHHPTRY